MSRQQLEQDLAYVRSSLRRAEPPASPRSITLFWALAMLIGFPLGDFRPEWMGSYWFVVGPLGWLLSGIMAVRFQRRRGQEERSDGYRQAIHWAAVVFILFMLSAMPARGLMPWQAMGPGVLLILCLAYATAAIHWGRQMAYAAACFALGFTIMLFTPPYPWTIVGLTTAVGLTLIALLTRVED